MTARRAFCYAGVGVLLALGAPLGWLTLRSLQGLPGGLPDELTTNAALYTYLLVGTALAFSVFGAILGKLADRMETLSVTDALTGLRNQGYFRERLASECARADREGTPLGLVMADLDHFKRLNDRLGHSAGDRALAHAASLLARHARAMDVACRVGGEEFALICPDASVEQTRAIAERMRQALESNPVPLATGPEPLTASFGIATHHPGGAADELFRAADAALYEAKRGGRNQVYGARTARAAL
ncbi:MAG: GGDEF domain-containing protein [Myxococcota bacterium]